MTKKYLAVVLLTALLTGGVETSTALELSQYNKLNTVSRIVNDSEVTDNLRKTFGNHYQTSDNSPVIHADIQQWSARFNAKHFATNGQSKLAFDGDWAGEFENDSTLTLRLAESGNRITGSYCYISQKGNRIDCPEDDERNLSGTIAGNRASVEFNSSFGGVGGRAVLEIKGGEMKWRLVSPPQNGNYYAPLHYTLRKAASVQHAESRKLDTEKFAISLINKCGHFESECDQMYYLGVRKSDNSTISLMGKTLRDYAGKIIGSTYKNGEIAYTVTYAPAKLVVSKGSHILVEQSGQWLK
ncbi:TPA: hypothetical protein QCI71_002881 [Enterobacter chuandaensis]|uniref:hypothetical protein n=1 Tax=Enterobacter nematophilus TaxID=2994648 RepID=UPI0032FBDD4E|nr:hypothetical protein [Enterobacter chuandaensis]